MAKGKSATNASKLDKRIGGNNKSGRGGFGDHPEHRHKDGQINSQAVAFSRSLRELMVAEGEATLEVEPGRREKKVTLMVRQLWSAAIRGESWAVQFIAERVEGRVPQTIDASVMLNASALDIIVHDDNPN